MTYRARARIEITDRPGGLARVAEVIARAGGNVVAIDVQEVGDERVCDELAIDLPDGVTGHNLALALAAVGASLVAFQPGDAAVDPVLRAMRWACAVVAAPGEGAIEEITRAIAEVCATRAAWVADAGAAAQFEPGRLATARGTPVVRRTTDVPTRLAPGPADEWWLLAVPDGRLDPDRVAFVARPVGHRFNATEIGRVEALLGLLRLVEAASLATAGST